MVSHSCHRLLICALACVSLASCGSLVDSLAHDERPVPNEVDDARVQRDALVPALHASIDSATGLFRFPVPNVAADEMPLDTASAQAAEYLFYVLNISVIRGAVEGQRGAFIDLPTLVRCSRPHLMRSVYERPPDSLPAAIRFQLGSYWTIPFCGNRRTPEVVVSIVTLGNNARYKNSQSVGDTTGQTLAFRIAGVPWEWNVEHVVTAEEAVNETFAVTGVRAAQLPEAVIALQVNGRQAGSVWCPLWRVALERPVRMAAVFSLRRLDLREVYVGDSSCPGVIGRVILATPLAEQPESREVAVVIRDASDPTGFRRVVHAARYKSPVNFESVIIER
ncbi:MAG TPA: hypothetical protein VJ717_11340 [Gemmatimonadaceae bacterium]|nr:hypothetical protein [Gemmatimonadaceae bacterium]